MGSALLVMDVQEAVVANYPDGSPALLTALARATAAARRAGVPVIYVRVGYRPGAPEVSPRNVRLHQFATTWAGMGLSDEANRVHPDIAPEPGDFEVVKKRASAFSGSDLDVLLRSLEITALVLSGLATGGVVLSTLRYAADLDFTLTVLSDACIDSDPEVHRVLTEKVFPRQSTVVTTAEWIAGLAAPA
jgi:nicotinamidase-related amidase